MTTAQEVLDVARSQIGTREAANGANPYGAAYGMDRVAWCAQFVWWCFRQAGASDLIMQKTAYTPTLFDWYRQRGRSGKAPQVGALVFYDWPDSVARIQHVGIVESVETGAIVTIEGNTTSGTAGDQSNGGGVWRRRRALNNSVVGFGYPAYAVDQEAPDLDARQAAQLDTLVAQFTGSAKGEPWSFPGWPGWQGGTAEQLTVVDYLRRNNVEVSQLHINLADLHRKVDALTTAPPAAGPALTADDVRELIREALADLGPLHLTAKETP